MNSSAGAKESEFLSFALELYRQYFIKMSATSPFFLEFLSWDAGDKTKKKHKFNFFCFFNKEKYVTVRLLGLGYRKLLENLQLKKFFTIFSVLL